MGRGEEEASLVVYGTPLENSDELSARRRAKALAKGTLRQQQPVWKQDARDSEGRRRFHGAFTGGFSAGYYNTVGSKEGWEPKTFKSSRESRAGSQQHSAYDYMDEDERKELDSKQIGTSTEFDTFGFTSAEYARKEATQETNQRPSIIPGPIPDEIIVPPTESIGVKLLKKMGWRPGRAIGPKHVVASHDVRREGRKAMIALARGASSSFENSVEEEEAEEPVDEVKELQSTTPSFVKNPKENSHGLGFDPFKSAPEFREAKRSRQDDDTGDKKKSNKPSMFRPGAGTMSEGFGIGALEEMGEEDEDVYATGPRPHSRFLEEEENDQPEKKIEKKRSSRFSAPKVDIPSYGKDGLPGFKLASEKQYQAEWYHPPVVPPDYQPIHKFTFVLDVILSQQELAPPEASPPESPILVKLIDGLATLVARSGAQLEALSREKNKENPIFQFLFGGAGSEYYSRKLWEERAKRGVEAQAQAQASKREFSKLSARERGELLGEAPLQASAKVAAPPSIPAEDRARLQATLNSSFMRPATETSESSSKPFAEDPEKQARYEQFLKDKYQGGLRKMNRGAQQLSEVQRAQEILEFEAVAHGARPLPSASASASTPSSLNKIGAAGDRFTTGGLEQAGLFTKGNENQKLGSRPPEPVKYPRRTEESWRPLPLLCKRFDLPDPYCGQKTTEKPKSRIDSLTLATPSESLWSSKLSDALNINTQKPEVEEDDPGAPAEEEPQEVVEKLTEKPVDLYKAIFSDDEEEEEAPPAAADDDDQQQQQQPEKNVDAANAALTRLVADDFLESLGKELGFAVPPSVPAAREPEEAPREVPKGHFKFIKPSKNKEKEQQQQQQQQKPATAGEAKVQTPAMLLNSGDQQAGEEAPPENEPKLVDKAEEQQRTSSSSREYKPETIDKNDHGGDKKADKIPDEDSEPEHRRSREKKRRRRKESREDSEARRKRKRRERREERKEKHRRHKSKRRHRSSSPSSSSSTSSSS